MFLCIPVDGLKLYINRMSTCPAKQLHLTSTYREMLEKTYEAGLQYKNILSYMMPAYGPISTGRGTFGEDVIETQSPERNQMSVGNSPC